MNILKGQSEFLNRRKRDRAKNTDNGPQNTTQKTKDWEKRSPQQTEGELRGSINDLHNKPRVNWDAQ